MAPPKTMPAGTPEQVAQVDAAAGRQAGKHAEDGNGENVVNRCPGKNECRYFFLVTEAVFLEFEHLRDHDSRGNGGNDEAQHSGFEERETQQSNKTPQ